MNNSSQLTAIAMSFASFALAGLSGAAITHSHAASLPFVIAGAFGTAPTGTTTPVVNSAPTVVGAFSGALAAGSPLAVTIPTTGFRAALVVWTIDAAGVKRIRSNGFISSAGGDTLALEFPTIPVTEIPVAYHTLKVGTTLAATWTYGVSNWNATGVTVGTVVNTSGYPAAGSVTVS